MPHYRFPHIIILSALIHIYVFAHASEKKDSLYIEDLKYPDSSNVSSVIIQLDSVQDKQKLYKFDKGKSFLHRLGVKYNDYPLVKYVKKIFAVDTNYVIKPKQRMSFSIHNQIYLDFIQTSFTDNSDDMRYGVSLRSPIRYNLGLSFSYRPITLSYYIHLNDLLKLDFSGIRYNKLHLVNSRFMFDYNSFTDNGKQYVTSYTIGDDRKKFSDVTFYGYYFHMDHIGLNIFFNHKRYAPSATTSASSIQRRSAGSFIAGFSYFHQKFEVNFDAIPDTIASSFPISGQFHTKSYDFCLNLGYAHNFVFHKRFTFNATFLPRIGLKRFFQQNDDVKYFVSVNPAADLALVYNHNRFFFILHSHADILYNLQENRHVASILTNHKATIGIRF